MKMKKIQRWIKSITLTILMIGAVIWVSAKTFFPLFLTSDVSNPVYAQDIQHNPGLSSVRLRLIDDKNLQFFHLWKNNPNDIILTSLGIQNKEKKRVLSGIKLITYMQDKGQKNLDWNWWVDSESFVPVKAVDDKDKSLYAHIDTPEDLQSFRLVLSYRHAGVGYVTSIFNFKDLNLDTDHLFPTNPDYENLRIEKKSDTTAEIFYVIEPTAPATVPAGYNFHFTRLEAEYAPAGNPDDVQSIELSFNAQRQAYFAVLDNLEAEANYVINRLIWHYTLTDQSDSSKSYPLFSSLPLPAASNSFNLNNLVTDAYVISATGNPAPAAVKSPAPVRAARNSNSLSDTSSNSTTIIAISAGVSGVLLLFGGLGYWFYRRRKKS